MILRFINHITSNLTASREELEASFRDILLEEELSKEYKHSEYTIESYSRTLIGDDRRISPTVWEKAVERIQHNESKLTGRITTSTYKELIPMTSEESVERESQFQASLETALERYRVFEQTKKVDNIMFHLVVDRQKRLEEVSSYLNEVDEAGFPHDEFYASCKKFLNLFYIEAPKRYKTRFGRKSVSCLTERLSNLYEAEKERLRTLKEAEDARTWFHFEVNCGEYEVFSEESQDEEIGNLLLELGYDFDALDDNWEIITDNFKLKVSFGNNYSYKVSFQKKGLLPIGTMGRRRLNIKEIKNV